MHLIKDPPRLSDIYNQRFCGVGMGQTWTALSAFEWILNQVELYSIIEFGTGQGGLSIFFALQARFRGMMYFTFDKIDRFNIPMGGENKDPVKNPPDDTMLGIVKSKYFTTGSIFDAVKIEFIKDILQDGPALIYCDNGAKPKELKTYAPLVEPGSVIGVHDWHKPHFGDLSEFEKENNLTVIMNGFCTRHKTRQRFWIKGGK